jgi:alpha-tubulin suppressor-like RCC1 family protein
VFTAVLGLGASGVARVGCGYSHTCVILESTKPQCFGYNSDYQLGNGGRANLGVPTDLTVTTGVALSAGGFDYNCLLMTDGSVQCVGSNRSGQLGDGTTTSSTVFVSVSRVFLISSI